MDRHSKPDPADEVIPQPALNDLAETPFNFWKATESSPMEDERYSVDTSQFYRYEFHPLPVMLACGTLGVLLIVGQLFVPYRVWMHGPSDFTGLIRMAMFFAGAIFIFMAWPRYRDVRISDEEEADTEAFREHLSRKKYRW